jgi:carbon storage regulator
MLILSRRPHESIRIGNDIVVTVLSTKGTQVRLGITAPKPIVVDRAEVHDRKVLESRMSTLRTPESPPVHAAAAASVRRLP